MANRFLLTFFIAAGLNVSVVAFSFIYEYLSGLSFYAVEITAFLLLLLVAVFLAVISGIIASLIPINNKVVFVIAGIFPMLLFVWSYIMGFYL